VFKLWAVCKLKRQSDNYSFRFAYIEFSDKESVRTSLALDESLFRGRQIKVSPGPGYSDAIQTLQIVSKAFSCISLTLRWSPNEPTDQASAQQTGVSHVPATVPGLPTTTVPVLDSTVVLTAGPGVASTGQDRWAAPLPRVPWSLCASFSPDLRTLHPSHSLGLQGLGLLPVQGEEGSCRPGQETSFIFSGAEIGDMGWFVLRDLSSFQPFFSPLELVAVKLFRQN
jgi:hypothetical protein